MEKRARVVISTLADMEFVPSIMNLAQLRRKKDISDLTFQVGGMNDPKRGRFYVLWKNGNLLVIQAEPFRRPGVEYAIGAPYSTYSEEGRAYLHLLEVIQTMLDTLVYDGEKNWAHLVRQKDNTYRLIYTTKRFVQKCSIWTKVIDLDEIELTRFYSAAQWEGVYQGKDVDLWIGWDDGWGSYVSAEANGHKIMQSVGLGHYTFEFLGPVAKNGAIIGTVFDAVIGRSITCGDRAAVFGAVADIQRHGVLLGGLNRGDIYITDHGVKFTNIAAASYHRNLDELADEAEICHWNRLAQIFDYDLEDGRCMTVSSSRPYRSFFFVIPRLPTPGRPVRLTHEEMMLRWTWATQNTYPQPKVARFPRLTGNSRQEKCPERGVISLPPDDDSETQRNRVKVTGENSSTVSRRYHLNIRSHPYPRSGFRRLLLPQE